MTIYRNFNKFQASYNEDISYNVVDLSATNLPNSLNRLRPKKTINVGHMQGNQIAGGLNIAKSLLVGSELVIGRDTTVLGHVSVDRNVEADGDVVVSGDITVQGGTRLNQNTSEHFNTQIGDKIITLGSGINSSDYVDLSTGVGIEVDLSNTKGLENVNNNPLFAYDNHNRFCANRLVALQQNISLNEFKVIINDIEHTNSQSDRDVVLAPIMYSDDVVANVGSNSNDHEIGWDKLKSNKLFVINNEDVDLSGQVSLDRGAISAKWGFVQLDLAHDVSRNHNATDNGMVDINEPYLFTVINNTDRDVEVTLPHVDLSDNEHLLFQTRNRRLAHPGHNVFVTTYKPGKANFVDNNSIHGQSAVDFWSGENLVSKDIMDLHNSLIIDNSNTVISDKLLAIKQNDISNNVRFGSWKPHLENNLKLIDSSGSEPIQFDNSGNVITFDYSNNYIENVLGIPGMFSPGSQVSLLKNMIGHIGNNPYVPFEQKQTSFYDTDISNAMLHSGIDTNTHYFKQIPNIYALSIVCRNNMQVKSFRAILSEGLNNLVAASNIDQQNFFAVELLNKYVSKCTDMVGAIDTPINTTIVECGNLEVKMNEVYEGIVTYVQTITDDSQRSNAIIAIHNMLINNGIYGPNVKVIKDEENEECLQSNTNLRQQNINLVASFQSDRADCMQNQAQIEQTYNWTVNGNEYGNIIKDWNENINNWTIESEQKWIATQIRYNQVMKNIEDYKNRSNELKDMSIERTEQLRKLSVGNKTDMNGHINDYMEVVTQIKVHRKDVMSRAANVREALFHLLDSNNNLINEDDATTLKQIKDNDLLSININTKLYGEFITYANDIKQDIQNLDTTQTEFSSELITNVVDPLPTEGEYIHNIVNFETLNTTVYNMNSSSIVLPTDSTYNSN